MDLSGLKVQNSDEQHIAEGACCYRPHHILFPNVDENGEGARYKSDNPNAVIANWMRNRNTIEYLGIWEGLYNPSFKPLEFEGFKKEAGLNAFTLSPKKWIDTTNAIGLIAKSGRYGGTYAHKDIAFSLSEFICAACINEQNYISFMKPASLVIETGFIDS